MAFKNSPFDGTMTAAVSGNLDFPKSNHPYSMEFLNVLSSTIQVDATRRPSLSQIRGWIQHLIIDNLSDV